MTLSLSTAFQVAAARGDMEPVFLVDIAIGAVCYITVNDYALGTTASITVTLDGNTLMMTAGTHFTAATSNTVTATNMAAAFNGTAIGLTFVRARARGALVAFFFEDTSSLVATVASSHATAYLSTPTPLPSVVYLCSGSYPISGYTNCVDDITGAASSLDVVTRAHTIGDVDIVVTDDGVLRDIVSRARMRGKTITITVGTPDMTPSDFAPVGVYLIDDVLPEPGSLTIKCSEPISRLSGRGFSGNFVSMHPIAIIARIMSLVGLPSTMYDSASFDSTDSDYAAISHWSVTRSYLWPQVGGPDRSNGIEEGEDPVDMINGLLELMQASMPFTEAGEYSFRLYDSTAAVVRTLTDDDLESFEQISTYDNIINECVVSGYRLESGGTEGYLYRTADTLSQLQFASEGSGTTLTEEIESVWLGHRSRLLSATGTAGTTLYLLRPTINGMSGARMSASSPAITQRSADQLNGTTRTAVLLISNGTSFEIVHATAYEPLALGPYVTLGSQSIAGAAISLQTATNYTEPTVTSLWDVGRYTVTRAQRGTSAVAWIDAIEGVTIWNTTAIQPVYVYDLTIPVHMAESRVSRFSNGCPIVKVRTSLAHYDLQVSDFVCVNASEYLNFQKDGSDTSIVWEVISKELDALGDSPGVTFTLAWVRDDVAYVSTLANPTYIPMSAVPSVPGIDDVVTDNDEVWVTDNGGFVVTV